ncbi:O-antigen ligase family protein [uncultured Enterovirga sp.]|uniref:O-antigen ligase family protein n=1 Tax=uncultured Enterovirga sp. TaxID=2026352 RepID=UPI0035CA71A8
MSGRLVTAGPGLAPSLDPEAGRSIPFRRLVEACAYGLFGLFIFFTCFTFLRPSPYDFAAIPAMLVWLALGIRLHKAAIVFLAPLILYHLGLISGLLPYLDEPEPTLWTFQSIYLMVTCIFFVMFFSDDAERRFDFGVKAYVASCIFAAGAGILSYFQATGILFTMDGRAAGVFEDPNVLGSFLVLGVLFLLRGLLTGESRHPIVSGAMILFIATAIFLSFSRGSWGALAAGTLLTVAFTFRSSVARIRRRIAILAAVGLFFGAGALAGLLSVGTVAETFVDRFTLTKDYDEGVTGRFGNQMRSIPLLAERPLGFGPLRFRLRFGLEPHNSYIGGFANGGWLGGFAFIGMVLVTAFVGLRLCLVPSPYRGRAQVVVPAVLMFFLQALQIDIDHWRHVYIMLGMVWGLECARVRWMAQQAPAAAGRMRARRMVPALTPAARAVPA